MILLDTDHLSELANRLSSRYAKLRLRFQETDQQIALPVVSVEEQCRGWLAQINRLHEVHKQIFAYDAFGKLIDFLREWDIIPLDVRAADEFERLRRQRLRLGTQDLKIASIALVNDALLLSANLRDFQRVPGLRVESWLE